MKGLCTRKLTGGYPGHTIFDSLDMDIPSCGITAIAGPNGAGKSTLLRYFIKELKADPSCVLVDGEDVRSLSQDEIARRMSFVGQNSLSSSGFTVRETVALGRFCHGGDDGQHVEKALQLCGIAHLADNRIDRISGGELQMTMLARAICQDTDIILLDEPVNNLDPYHQVALMKLLVSLAKEGKTVVCVLHDLNAVLKYCDSCILMEKGGIFAQGKTEDVLTEDNVRALYGLECRIKKDPETGSSISYL